MHRFYDKHSVHTPDADPHLSAFNLVELEQVHGPECIALQASDPLWDTFDSSERMPAADAVLTDRLGTALCIRSADCLPILISHPSGVVGAVHAGRKGTIAGITQRTLELLKRKWNVTDDLELFFGPSICVECYQVDREKNLYFDLLTENITQIHAVFPEKSVHIHQTHGCTLHHNDRYYSYRAHEPSRNFSVIWL